MTEPAKYNYRPGGLMRCCTLTLANLYEPDQPGEPETAVYEGARLPCNYCSSKMVFKAGAWEWDKSRAPIHGNSQPPLPPEAEMIG